MAKEQDRREQILEAAFEEFAKKGFREATIKSIAETAGLRSPALIYWYFENKEALLREILNSRIPAMSAAADLEPMMDLPPEQVLPKIGRAYLALDSDPRTLPLVVGEALRRQEVAEMVATGSLRRVLDVLKKYLQHQVEIGRLRPHDTRSSARAFVGMLIPRLAGKHLLPALGEDGLGDEEHLKTVTEIFLGGLELGKREQDRRR